MLILGSLWTPKTLKKKQCFFKVFANAAFWVFEAPNGPLGPILAPSWPDLVPKRSRKLPQKVPKSGPKNVQKTAPKQLNFKTILGSNLEPFWGQMAPKYQLCEFAGTIRPAYGTPKTF